MNSFLVELLTSCFAGIFGAGIVWGTIKAKMRYLDESDNDIEKKIEALERWQKEIAIPIMQTNIDARTSANEALQRLDARVGIIAKETWDELRRKVNREEFTDRHNELSRQIRNIRNGD